MKLSEVAAEMRSALGQGRKSHRVLMGGLHLVMERATETAVRLAIGRPGQFPSSTEADIVEETFQVPPGTEREALWRSHRSHKSGYVTKYGILEWIWEERPTADRVHSPTDNKGL